MKIKFTLLFFLAIFSSASGCVEKPNCSEQVRGAESRAARLDFAQKLPRYESEIAEACKSSAEYRLAAARALTGSHQPDAALELIRQVGSADERYADQALLLEYFILIDEQPLRDVEHARAEQIALEEISRRPDHFMGYMLLGGVRARQGKSVEAIGFYDKGRGIAGSNSPEFSSLEGLFPEVLFNDGRYEDSFRIVQFMSGQTDVAKSDLKLQLVAAYSAAKIGKARDARNLLEAAAAQAPDIRNNPLFRATEDVLQKSNN